MENKISKDDLTNIIKLYKIFDDSEILIMVKNPDLITDDNLKNSLINFINTENDALGKMKEYFDKYNTLTGGKGRRGKKSRKKRSKKKTKKKKPKKKKRKKKKKGEGDGEESNQENSAIQSDKVNNKNSIPTVGNNRVSGTNMGMPNITINNNNNNGTQTIDDKNIPQISIPLKFVINSDDAKAKKKGGTNIEINKSDGLDVLKNALNSGETEFNLSFDFNKDIDYQNQDFSKFMTNIKDFVKEKSNDISNNKNVPEFKKQLKQKINSINNLLPPFYSQDIVLP